MTMVFPKSNTRLKCGDFVSGRAMVIVYRKLGMTSYMDRCDWA